MKFELDPHNFEGPLKIRQGSTSFFLMFFSAFLICTVLSKGNPPFIIFPPMFGSVLYATVENLNTSHWFCPRNVHDTWVWEADEFLVPPMTDCSADYLRCGWNWTTGRPDSRNESYVYTVDFGGDLGIRYLDQGIFGHHFVHDMDGLLDYFEARGYTVRDDVFGAPYDWRLSPVGIEGFYVQARNLVEENYNKTGKKQILFGYSGGCFAIQYFLSRKVSQEWKDKYIDYTILVGPSSGGSYCSVLTLWYQTSWFPGGESVPMQQFTISIPTLYTHIPNYVIHKDKIPIYGPDGRKYRYEEMRQLFYEHGKVDNYENRLIYEFSEKDVLSVDLEDPGVDSYFIFNSALPTMSAFNFSAGWDQDPEMLYELGDSVISKEALYWGCENWKSGHHVVCHDYLIENETWGHGAMLTLDEILEDIHHNIVTDEWRQEPGNFVLEGIEKRKRKI